MQGEYLLSGVNPELARRVRLVASMVPFELKIWYGFRSVAEQTATYNNRANNPNPVARPGYSPHEWGVAVDMTPLSQSTATWRQLWDAGQRVGLVLGRDFRRTDPAHFELPGFNHNSANQPGLRQYGIMQKPAGAPSPWSWG